MVKWGSLSVVLLIGAIALSGCEQKVDTVMKEETFTKEMSTLETPKETVLIYYGNKSGDGLVAEEVIFEKMTQERLLVELTGRNIVTMDTKIQKLEVKVEEGKNKLYLDLSKQFKEYVRLMGTSGEYIVIASLTNTFLDAYDAVQMVLTVDGDVLKTGHSIYEEPLTFYPMEEKKNLSAYTWKEETIITDTVSIKYPQFADMPDENRMNKWNRMIAEKADGDYENQKKLKNYVADYEITTENAGVVSMIIRGSCYYEDAAYPTEFKCTYNFDLTSGKNLRLKDYIIIEKAAKCFQQGTGYTVLQEGVTAEDLASYLQSDDLQKYINLLENFDYDFENKNIIPTGYSYMKEDKVVMLIEVPHVMGDVIEVQFDAETVQ